MDVQQRVREASAVLIACSTELYRIGKEQRSMTYSEIAASLMANSVTWEAEDIKVIGEAFARCDEFVTSLEEIKTWQGC